MTDTDTDKVRPGFNLARFFVDNRPIAWVLLVANLCWGCFGFYTLPQRKDPYIPMRRSVVVFQYPGADARQVEELVAKPIEQAVSRCSGVAKIESVSRPGVAYVYIVIDEYITTNIDQAFDDIKVKLDDVHNLPPGAGPIHYDKDYADTAAVTLSVAGPVKGGVPAYSNQQLDDYTDLIMRTLQRIDSVYKVTRSGIVPPTVDVDYSEARLIARRVGPAVIAGAISAQAPPPAGGPLETGDREFGVTTVSGPTSSSEIGNLQISTAANGDPVRIRDVADITDAYQDPPTELDYVITPDGEGGWSRRPAVTVAIYMRPGGNIAHTGQAVDDALRSLKARLPGDLIITHVSDQPQQVREAISLFGESLWQAILLIIIVSLIGFQDWRSALLMAVAIPLTFAMTGGLMALCGVDIQQVSVASLIIAAGLLVDDPVVAGDAIKRELGAGRLPQVAAWLGPTKLAAAIAFATFTNIVAYLPFLILRGDTGRFLYALPVVMTCALIASRIVSMTFVPLIGAFLLRAPGANDGAERLTWFHRAYGSMVHSCMRHRGLVAAGSLIFLAGGGLLFLQIKQSFFPYDAQYLSYIELALPNDAPLAGTDQATQQAERIIERVAADHKASLLSINTFVGNAAPRFWFTLFPQQPAPNYAMLVVRMAKRADTTRLHVPLQEALDAGVPGARIDVHELETGRPIGIPVAVRVSGDDPIRVRQIADQVEAIYRRLTVARRVRDDWGAYGVELQVHPDLDAAARFGITGSDVSNTVDTATSGVPIGELLKGDKQIPVILRVRNTDRGPIEALSQVTVFPGRLLRAPASDRTLPPQIGQVAQVTPVSAPIVIRHLNQFPCITVSCFPTPGHLASEVVAAGAPDMDKLQKGLPTGYSIEQGGEIEEQEKAFLQLVTVLLVSIAGIYLALVLEFRHAVKPLLVFATVPYGVIGAVIGLRVMNEPFGFMAFLGIISLIGVLVSHIIVLFDFIEHAREEGQEFETALVDAGVQRLRPILITVAATVLAFVPLSLHGGPLWEPLCYAQIGGLCMGAVATLILVPVFYALFVKDWKLIKWAVEGDSTQ